MAGGTKKAILECFRQMLTEMPFDRITVSALVRRCGVSSNTFYYHFRDIYDLLETYLLEWYDSIRAAAPDEKEWPQRLKTVLRDLKCNPEIVRHLTNSLSRETYERFLYGRMLELFFQEVRKRAEGLNLPDETVQIVSDLYCFSAVGFILKFVRNGMTDDVGASVDRLKRVADGVVEYILKREETLECAAADSPVPGTGAEENAAGGRAADAGPDGQ